MRDYAYDVALLKTSNAIKVGKTAKAIKLAKSTPKQGTQAKIVGYGMYMVSIITIFIVTIITIVLADGCSL